MNKQERSHYDLSPQQKNIARDLVQKVQSGDKKALKTFKKNFTEKQIEVIALDVLGFKDVADFKKSLRTKPD